MYRRDEALTLIENLAIRNFDSYIPVYLEDLGIGVWVGYNKGKWEVHCDKGNLGIGSTFEEAIENANLGFHV